MQSKEKDSIDTRIFPIVWKNLSSTERDNLALEFYKRKCCTTRQTIHNWAAGNNMPAPLIRDVVASCVEKITGRKTSGHYLFPES